MGYPCGPPLFRKSVKTSLGWWQGCQTTSLFWSVRFLCACYWQRWSRSWLLGKGHFWAELLLTSESPGQQVSKIAGLSYCGDFCRLLLPQSSAPHIKARVSLVLLWWANLRPASQLSVLVKVQCEEPFLLSWETCWSHQIVKSNDFKSSKY